MNNPPKEAYDVLYKCLSRYNKSIKKDKKLSMAVLSSNQYRWFKRVPCANHGWNTKGCTNRAYEFGIGKRAIFTINAITFYIDQDCLGSGPRSFRQYIKEASGMAEVIAVLPIHMLGHR